jgi:hypothetical protein
LLARLKVAALGQTCASGRCRRARPCPVITIGEARQRERRQPLATRELASHKRRRDRLTAHRSASTGADNAPHADSHPRLRVRTSRNGWTPNADLFCVATPLKAIASAAMKATLAMTLSS